MYRMRIHNHNVGRKRGKKGLREGRHVRVYVKAAVLCESIRSM
jgi:hypothetical protein